MKHIALIGEFDPARETQLATMRAIEHSSQSLGLAVRQSWISTSSLPSDGTSFADGIWVAPGSVFRDQVRLFAAIQHARESGLPCFGTCGGFQQIVLEYARSVLGLSTAQSEEYDPTSSEIVISRLACSLRGKEMRLEFATGSAVARYYRGLHAIESYYCNFGIDPAYQDRLKKGPMKITGKDSEGEARVIEWPGHPFFLATLYVPQVRSTREQPHPLVTEFLRAL